jgi:hypothetical protein
MRKWRLVALLWIGAAGVTCWAAFDGVATAYNQCDNVAGTCLRDRQIAAITAVQATLVALAAVCLTASIITLFRPRQARLLIVAAIAVAFSAAYLAFDPITNLNNSRTGWLAG